MFIINEYMIIKMGWSIYSTYTNGIKLSYPNEKTNFDESLIRYFIIDKNNHRYYFILENQDDKNIYNFIIVNNKDKKINISDFKSNIELFKLISKYNACGDKYQRNFNINKILK